MELSCPLGIRALSRKENLLYCGVLSHIINPLLTKLCRCVFMDLDLANIQPSYSVHKHAKNLANIQPSHSVHKHVKKELGQPAILTSHWVNNPYIEARLETSLSQAFGTPQPTNLLIGHFRITFSLFLKTSLGVHPFRRKMRFLSYGNESHFIRMFMHQALHDREA